MKRIRRLLLTLLCLPFQLLVFLLLAGAEAISRVRGQQAARTARQFSGPCSLVVLNWNGRHLLESSLPALKLAAETDGQSHQILVVDNGSSDDSLSWLARWHPDVDVLPLAENVGFGEGNNRGVKQCLNDVVVLLNNDMIVSPDFLRPLLEPFRTDPDVFAVSAQIEFSRGKRREETGNTQARWRAGYLELAHEALTPAHFSRRYLPVLWAGGGSAAFDRLRFLALGGFADIYSPCYLEDTELSYRAWRRGWKVLLAAPSRVLHKHRSTTSVRFSPQQLTEMIEQRKLWYLWRNFDLVSLARHGLYLPFHLGDRLPFKSYLRALRSLPGVVASRAREPRRSVADRRLLRMTSDPHAALDQCGTPREFRSSRAGKPKLLMISAYLPHMGFHGGAGRVCQLLKQLSRSFEITLVSFLEGEQERELVAQVEPLCRRVVTLIRENFEHRSPFPYEPFEEFNSRRMRETIRNVVAEEDFDLVDFEWTQMALYADLLPYTPRILTEIEVNWAAHRTQIPYLDSPLARFHQRYRTLHTLYREVELCRKVDCVVCVTEEDRGYLRRFLGGRRIEVINTGVDLEEFSFSPRVEEPDSLLYVGAFRHDPNVDAMLYFCRRILPRIRQQGLAPHLYIVGAGPPPIIRELAADPGITVTGYVEDIQEYYRRCQIVVVPLRTGVGIRGKVLEAWSVGRPVVATSLACQGLDVLQGNNVLLADDPEVFSDWVSALLRHREFGEKLGRGGRLTVERLYSWQHVGDQVTRLYRTLSAPKTDTVP